VDLERNAHTLRTELTYGDWQDRFSGTLGMEGLFEDQKSKGTSGLTPGGQIENLAIFAINRYALDRWSFETGLRFDHRSQEAEPSQTADPSLLVNRVDPISGAPVDVDLNNEYNVVTASLGTVFQAAESFAVAANINRGFRAPELFELYSSGEHGGVAAIQFGEADLDPENSLGGDLQARWRSEKFDWTATAYMTAFSDYIYLADTGFTDAGSGLPIFKMGQADAELYGADFAIAYRPTHWLTASAVYEVVRGEFDSGEGLPLLPADQLQFEILFHRDVFGILQKPEFRIGVRHVFNKDASGPQEPFSQFDRNPNFGTASTDSYTLLDVSAGFEIDNFRFDIAVENLTDEAYRDFLDTYKGYALSPGRSIMVQGSFSF
jgi:outer membrane receptor protein involved in Fe transport